MTKKWKWNDLKGKYKSWGEQVYHPEGGFVGTVFPGSAEVVAEIASNVVENSEEINEVLEDL